MRLKENLIVIMIVIVLYVYFSQNDVIAATREGSKRLNQSYSMEFMMVEDLGIIHFEKIDMNTVYTEAYTYNISTAKITYYKRTFYYDATLTGVYKNVAFKITLPRHINTSSNTQKSFLWSSEDGLFPKCDYFDYLVNSTSATYTALDSYNVNGEYTITFYCDGAIIPYKAATGKINLKYK